MAQSKFSVALVAGLVGAAVGILFAPRSGKETREQISERAEEMKSTTREKARKMKEATQKNAEDMKDTIDHAVDEVKELKEEAKVRGSRVADDASKTSGRMKRRMDENRDETPQL